MHPVEVAGSVSDPGAMESSFLKPSLAACHSDSPSGRAVIRIFRWLERARTGFPGFPIQMFFRETCEWLEKKGRLGAEQQPLQEVVH